MSGSGCIATAGGSGEFNFTASFTYADHSTSGAITYSIGETTYASTTLVDYADDGYWRGFVYVADGSQGYDEIRVFVVDNGDTGDTFEIQVLNGGGIIYQAGGVVGDCPEPEPEPGPEPEPEKPPRGDNGNHYGQERPHGNNGVGNGEDPQPPGNPPINDGPGTGPGNPGNRGGSGGRQR